VSWYRTTGLFILLAGLLACGCASRRGAAPLEQGPASTERALDETRELTRKMEQLEQELAATQATATPNCQRAQALAGTICHLSERICRIADHHPAQAELAQRCRDAKASCERSRVKVAVRCPMGF